MARVSWNPFGRHHHIHENQIGLALGKAFERFFRAISSVYLVTMTVKQVRQHHQLCF